MPRYDVPRRRERHQAARLGQPIPLYHCRRQAKGRRCLLGHSLQPLHRAAVGGRAAARRVQLAASRAGPAEAQQGPAAGQPQDKAGAPTRGSKGNAHEVKDVGGDGRGAAAEQAHLACGQGGGGCSRGRAGAACAPMPAASTDGRLAWRPDQGQAAGQGLGPCLEAGENTGLLPTCRGQVRAALTSHPRLDLGEHQAVPKGAQPPTSGVAALRRVRGARPNECQKCRMKKPSCVPPANACRPPLHATRQACWALGLHQAQGSCRRGVAVL